MAYAGGQFNQQGFYQPPDSSYTIGEPSGQGYTGGAPAPPQYYTPQPQQFGGFGDLGTGAQASGLEEDYENEPPLLEELGINFSHITAKTFAVLNPLSEPPAEILGDADLAGPLCFCVAFGAGLLLAGKVHFGFIYGIGVLGCLSMYALLNLMADGGISVTHTISILGYCLLPMTLLSLFAVAISLQGAVGTVLTGIVIFWCSLSSSKLIVRSLNMHAQHLLVAYPCALIYGIFALLAMF